MSLPTKLYVGQRIVLESSEVSTYWTVEKIEGGYVTLSDESGTIFAVTSIPALMVVFIINEQLKNTVYN